LAVLHHGFTSRSFRASLRHRSDADTARLATFGMAHEPAPAARLPARADWLEELRCEQGERPASGYMA
jgi:hypothetical protein